MPNYQNVVEDFTAHGFFERLAQKQSAALERRRATKQKILEFDFHDECDVDYEELTQDHGHEHYKGSHTRVPLAYDGKTPLATHPMIFIDEDSCIGCSHCWTIAPRTFVKSELGRARCFDQSGDSLSTASTAVSSCPVSCMHKVSFEELTEFEKARDYGDGRTDHKHVDWMGNSTPIHVSGMSGSDANHKSSW